MFNRLGNCHNKYQDLVAFPRTLALCSAGMLRSPTIAWILSNPPYNRNTRAAGCSPEYALIPLDQVLLEWADEIVCAQDDHFSCVKEMHDKLEREIENKNKTFYCLNIPDEFKYRDERLVKMIQEELKRVGFPEYNGK
jgi:predicted protein tyrosine phosphatase